MRNLAVRLFPLLLCATPAVWAGAHTWDVQELFSNADGTIQFIELLEANGGIAEGGVGGAGVSSVATGKASDGCPNVTGNTANKRYLVATPAFAALPGAPTPNCTLTGVDVTNFFSIVADTVRYGSVPYDTTSFSAGQLPTDGVRSLNKVGPTGRATPTNYAGQTFLPPAADGLLVSKVTQNGSQISLSWSENCLGAARYHIVSGLKSDLPPALLGTYNLQLAGPGQCAITAPPALLTSVPDPGPGTYSWYLVLADNGSTVEGSWGRDSFGNQRTGPVGLSKHSGQCGMSNRSIVNTCAQ